MEYKMSKYEILKHSGCLKRLLTSLVIAIVSACGIIALNKIHNRVFQMIVGAISSACFFTSITIVVKDLVLLVKIILKRYRITTKKLKALESRRPFDTYSANNKVLVFNNLRITVEENFAKNLSIGDSITLVFANKIQYPIIIIKREACLDGSK